MKERNVYLYWVNKEPSLILILRKLIYMHSKNGKGYNVHLITDKNIKEYIQDIPEYFNTLCPAHQADFLRVIVLSQNGGIWLDSDTLVIDKLDSLFDILETKQGFFIIENNHILSNGIFGTQAGTPLMLEWKKQLEEKLNINHKTIKWTEIGSDVLEKMKKENSVLYDNYHIFNGLDNLYPVNWNDCVSEFIYTPYNNYKNIIRSYQPLLILVNTVYKELSHLTEEEILKCSMPLNYFINLSIINNAGVQKNDICNNKAVFEYIYKNSIWNDNNSSIPLSGPGSSIENTQECSKLLNDFIYQNSCHSVLDLGCGDLTWISKTQFFNDKNIKYTGIDVVEFLINNHSKSYSDKKFVCKDLVDFTDIEMTSLIIIRDVIFHLENKDISMILKNIYNKFKFIAITSCKNSINTDDFNKWRFTEKNIHKEPFNIPATYDVKLDEPKFNRYFYIYKHDEFYKRM